MSSSIQSLLKTEKEAASIVHEARKYRAERLKSAKADAQKEISEYKAQKEEELKKFTSDHAGLNSSVEKEAEESAKRDLEDIQKKYAEKKADVIKMLVAAATKPTPKMHINA